MIMLQRLILMKNLCSEFEIQVWYGMGVLS